MVQKICYLLPMGRMIIILFLLNGCASGIRSLPTPERDPAAKYPQFVTSCVLHLRQIFGHQDLVIKGDDLFWRHEKIINYPAANKLYYQISEQPFYPDLHPRFDDLFWAYLFSLPPEFQWLLEIAVRKDAIDLLNQLDDLFSVHASSITSSLREWVLRQPNQLQRQKIWQEQQQWWKKLTGDEKIQLKMALKNKINQSRINYLWKKYYYVPINVEKKSDNLVTVTIGPQSYSGKMEDQSLFLTVPPSLVKIREDNPLNHLKETAARTKGPPKYYAGSFDLDGKITLFDGNHTFYLYSRSAPAVVIQLNLPLKTVNIDNSFNQSSSLGPSQEKINLLVRGKLKIFDLLPPQVRDKTPWQETDFVTPPFPFVDLFD